MSTRQEAEELITKLCEDNGGISESTLEWLEERNPSDFRGIQSMRRKLGATTKALATQLYSRDIRFVYELVQNADDNTYCQATSKSIPPSLHFAVRGDSIIIDSNEDGFRPADVEAICSTAESSKKSSGYIGEKGIGFKSVFKVARKVHIQSGHFSFAFEYIHGGENDGLAMVTPILEPHKLLPDGVKTRMTLKLLDPSDVTNRISELRALPETLLLFVRKLRILTVEIPHPSGGMERIEYERVGNSEDSSESIIKWVQSPDGTCESTTRRFLVASRMIHDLPADSARENITTAEVVLAFPVSDADIPIVESQQVYAYLPLRPVGFKFLIQSDFITQASREDVFHSPRNQALLEGAAQTFRDAVLQFLDHETLQYQWMRYLPDDKVTDEFWTALRPAIQKLLREAPILKSWSLHGWHKPSHLKYLSVNARDAENEPLFQDLVTEGYLAKEYEHHDFLLLKQLGCSVITIDDIIDRVEADLKALFSRIKSSGNSDWHMRVASLLSLPFMSPGPGHENAVQRLQHLSLIPLIDKSWVSASGREIYFPDSGLCSIPSDIELLLIDPSKILCEPRKRFFEHLGATDCDPQVVIEAIYRKHSFLFPKFGLMDIVHHMKYIYFYLPEDKAGLHFSMSVAANKEGRTSYISLSKYRIYLNEAEDEYGAVQLFKQGPDPGLAVWILSKKYHSDPPLGRYGLPWLEWLQKIAGVWRTPPASENGVISKEFDYLLDTRPQSFFCMIQKNWPQYHLDLASLQNVLKTRNVRSLGGELVLINKAYYPLEALEALDEEFGLGKNLFIPVPGKDSEQQDWIFLELLGVRFTDDLDFYLAALRKLSDKPRMVLGGRQVFAAYKGIMDKTVTENDCEKTKIFFRHPRVYLPPRSESSAKWETIEECRWAGPAWLEKTSCLNSYAEYSQLEHLFRTNLRLKDADHHDFLSELEWMKEDKVRNTAKVSKIYHDLWRMFEKDRDFSWIRNEFERRSLVYIPRLDAWHPPSNCVWADEKSALPGMVSISTSFASEEEFLCTMLGISKPSIQMRVTALKGLSKKQDFEGIKHELVAISSLRPSPEDLKSLHKTNLFPVHFVGSDAKLTNAESDWVIFDRKEFEIAFEGQRIYSLAYAMDEVHKIRKCLEAMHLERRYMSVAVEETTKVERGTLNWTLTNTMRQKAYALYRCAAHYQSPVIDSHGLDLFRDLQNIEIYESDQISKSMQVTQYGQIFTVESSRSNIHLEEHHGQIKIYVPAEENKQYECFLLQLPREISKFLGILDDAAISALKSIVGAVNLHILDRVLGEEGIIEVEGIQRPSTSETLPRNVVTERAALSPAPSEAWVTLTPPSATQQQHRDTSPEPSIFGVARASPSPLRQERRLRAPEPFDFGASQVSPSSPLRRDQSRSPEPFIFGAGHSASSSPQGRDHSNSPVPFTFGDARASPTPLFRAQDPSAAYATILNHVIQASASARIPRSDGMYRNGSPTELTRRFSGLSFQTQLDRDMSVGAAGELFVFETLETLDLPEFGLANWQSRIRHRVRVHEKYRDLASWQGVETSDIIYEDNASTLTLMLSLLGYINIDEVSTTPKYYIEVKTTTGSCDDVFYMSNNQYQLMQRLQMVAGTQASEVMIIARVFNVDQHNIGLRLFVDPEAHRRNGTLTFASDKWCVRPVT